MAYGYFKDLNRRTVADKVLDDKRFSVAKNLKYDGYQSGTDLMVYQFFDKKPSSGATTHAGSETLATRNKSEINPQLKMKIFIINNEQRNYKSQLLENLIKEKYTHLL